MADVHNLRRGGDVPIPEEVLEYLDKWDRLYRVIIHRGEQIPILRTPKYVPSLVTNDVRPKPSLLCMNELWCCGALIALVLGVHDGIDRDWLFENAYPYPKWAGRVLGKVLLTVGAAVLSTVAFEVVGSIATRIIRARTLSMQNAISAFLTTRFGWEEEDEGGEPNLAFPREAIRASLQGLASLGLNYFLITLLESSNQLTHLFTEWILGPCLYFLFSIPVDFVPTVLSWLYLPTPGLDTAQDPRTLWHEYGVPIIIQFWVTVFLWLLMILFQAKAERLAMQGWRVIDPKIALVCELIRATAMHMFAYTAYQIVCASIVALRSELPKGSPYITIIDGPIVPFLGRIVPEGRIFAAGLLFFAHFLLRAFTNIAIIILEGFWSPYILWQTRISAHAIGRFWILWRASLMEDFGLTDPGKRVTSRAAMTAVFGLKSSWPARFHLSHAIEDVE
ncbi:hypothetical protein GGS24DRAFT_393874 [Hypoxylon argillaceum]|nr:hypothetical protein GGS24DRAFT_393874 [Hypoxylon argillaceum]